MALDHISIEIRDCSKIPDKQVDRNCRTCMHDTEGDYQKYCRLCFANGRKYWEPKMNKISEQERKATYKVALRKWGIDSQVMMAVEEMSELTKEICKLFRGQGTMEALADEIADVTIMLEQLRQIYNISDMVEDHIDMKIHRLQERLGMLEVGHEKT